MELVFTILSLIVVLAETTKIETSLGVLEGNRIGTFHSFKKIPFARAPIGKLRFQKPESPEKWEGILNAKEYGPACMSNSSETTSPQKWVDEDCLHVNIFTSDKCLESKDCAVVFYLHGGEILYDSAVMFNDSILIDTFASRDVVLVIPAFRLGIFSHFTVQNQSIAPNNLGLFDIVRGLEFVKSEIRNFGGDNQKVTIFGHSYGGHIVSTLQFSKRINTDLSLFQKTVSMSTVVYFRTLEENIENTKRFAGEANCLVPPDMKMKMTEDEQDNFMMECLQKVDGMELLRIQRKLEDEKFPLYEGLIIREPLIQEESIRELLESSKNVPTLLGCTSLELDVYMAYHDVVKTMGYENQKECDEKFRKDKELKRYDFENHADETLAILAQTKLKVDTLLSKNIPTYLYEYSYPKHAVHTEDLSYLFGVHSFEKDENEAHLANVYQEMFTNFVKTGEPGLGFEKTNKENSSYFNVFWNETTGEKPRMKNNFKAKIVKYWLGEMMEFDRNVTEAKRLKKASKVPTMRFYSEISSDEQIPYMFISIFLISLIFITGCLFGKYCYNGERDRNLYIRLDGNDHDWHSVKNF
uniref:COesterase domain-containing protein n=1 Tax=Caenorhabditis tropicalis TaxID=1561998 RepID=A0A1I7V045_9PELO